MTIRALAHYLQRTRQLGAWGTVQRVGSRIVNEIVLWSQSLWWGFKARRKMSDAAFLARTIGGWRSVDAFLEHLANRPASSFVLPHDSPNETAAILDRHFPGYFSLVVAAADASCRNELSLLGKNFCFTPSIDWHKDPVTGWRWPVVHRSRVGQYLGSDREVDLQVFWKLNRHQHFITLGIAYWLTGDQRYVDAFNAQLQSWIETNPLQHGVNWYYGIEVSIRIVAWTVAFQFFRGSPAFREKTGRAFLKSLWQQADFLSSHLQTSETPAVVPNNHIVAELTGLALVGSAFPEFRNAAAWRDTGLHLLDQQATAQTYSDGVNKEQATGYHRFVAELLLLVLARSRESALPHAPALKHILERMLDYVLFSTLPGGKAPMWGDSDYARALGLGYDRDFWDFRPLLAAGAALYGRPDWKFVAGRFDEEAFWLLGAPGWNRWEQLDAHRPKQTSRGFPNAGLYVIRNAWAADADVALFRCGPFGLGGEGHCAHAHCDLLSLFLCVNGQPLLVDSGTYRYHGPWRDPFRLTAAHNTVMINGRDQAIPIGLFKWKQIPQSECIDWTGKRVTGALTYANEAQFTRELTHLRTGVWQIVDTISALGETTLEWFFHFAPDLELDLHEQGNTVTVFREGQAFLVMHTPDGGVHLQVRDSWYSHQYGIKQRNRALYARWEGELHGNGVPFHWKFQLLGDSSPSKG